MIIIKNNNNYSNNNNLIFFKIVKNKLLVKKILEYIKIISDVHFFYGRTLSSTVTVRYHHFVRYYHDINDTEWICRNGYFALLLDKLVRGDRLVWSKHSLDTLFEHSRSLGIQYFSTLFELIGSRKQLGHIYRYCLTPSAIVRHTESLLKNDGDLQVFCYFYKQSMTCITTNSLLIAIESGSYQIINYLYHYNTSTFIDLLLSTTTTKIKDKKLNILQLAIESKSKDMILFIYHILINNSNINNNNNSNNYNNSISIYYILKCIDDLPTIRYLLDNNHNNNLIEFTKSEFYSYIDHAIPIDSITINHINIVIYILEKFIGVELPLLSEITKRVIHLSSGNQLILNQLVLFELLLSNSDIYNSVTIKYKVKHLISLGSMDITRYLIGYIDRLPVHIKPLLLEYCSEVGTIEQLCYIDSLDYAHNLDYVLDLANSYDKLVYLYGKVKRLTHLAVDNAAYRGDIDSVAFLIGHCQAPFRSAVYTAASKRHLNVLEYLLNHLNNLDTATPTPFYFHYNNCQSVEFLVTNFARLSQLYRFQENIITIVFQYACYYGYKSVVLFIIEYYSASVCNSNKYLELAVMAGQVEILYILMDWSESTNRLIISSHWQYCLCFGDRSFHQRVIQYCNNNFGSIQTDHLFEGIFIRGQINLLRYLHQDLKLKLPLDIELAIVNNHIDIIEYYQYNQLNSNIQRLEQIYNNDNLILSTT
ncbi:hypothetical protein PPL_08237 [Heterostelium album PN500]|uniref:Ankyrin repeat-containing protein n=1 Tax=Heterostelium pallidum (strain ATCC 26659 / Pp 5 / PN500) TaxID=670386 RepID=D3BJ02_HETP5|nr:hypothetical protein PPL_08237 [Heterostelium album PN500]EFA78776.1 hypothetical protein PPL_08237 [Heterostelium album PN500]|eukprot:XP_020430900.1 hypothetical protein PPL_08237 [Heterostelium album PN500]